MFYREVTSTTSLPYAGNCAFFTNNKSMLLSLIKSLDEDEFNSYGCRNADFIIPIYELTANSNNDFILPEMSTFKTGYTGKFELDIKKLIEVCNDKGVQFFLYIEEDSYF